MADPLAKYSPEIWFSAEAEEESQNAQKSVRRKRLTEGEGAPQAKQSRAVVRVGSKKTSLADSQIAAPAADETAEPDETAELEETDETAVPAVEPVAVVKRDDLTEDETSPH